MYQHFSKIGQTSAGGSQILYKAIKFGKRLNLPFLIPGGVKFFLTVSLRVRGEDMGVGGVFERKKAISGGVQSALPYEWVLINPAFAGIKVAARAGFL